MGLNNFNVTGTIGNEPPNGRLELNSAALFKFTKNDVTHPAIMIPKVSVSNGLTWSLDGTEFYYIDTPSEEIVKYNYYSETGCIENRTVVFSTKNKGMGFPDGNQEFPPISNFCTFFLYSNRHDYR